MNARRRILALLAGAAMLSCAFTGCSAQKQDPVTITIWTYYNGEQLESFNAEVKNFNDTVGKEKGITVESYSQGSVNDLEANVMNAAEGKVGADPLPNIFSAYADTAYALDQMGMVVNLKDYLSDEECAEYIDSYLAEGDFDNSGSIKIFPVAKSTEVLFLNDTDWQTFAAETGADYDDLSTIEGLVATAEKYYNWTDAQTPEANDGRALFGRDAMANYMLIGAQELGCTIFQVDETGKMALDFDRDTVRTLWDHYYVPFVKGYFDATGRFRSDDVKAGNLLAYTGSNSSATFFPTEVMTSDTESHTIALKVLPNPHFSGCDPVSVQQGAGMVVTGGDENAVRASVEFLKWFTQSENNISFSVGSGYLPVTHAASDMQAIENSGLELSPIVEEVLNVAVDTVNNNTLYTPHAFANGQDARKVLEYAMSDRATADRETVEERLAEGQSLSAATADFLSDENFDNWYQETLDRLTAL